MELEILELVDVFFWRNFDVFFGEEVVWIGNGWVLEYIWRCICIEICYYNKMYFVILLLLFKYKIFYFFGGSLFSVFINCDF